MGYNHQESIENTINTMGTRTLGVHQTPVTDCIKGILATPKKTTPTNNKDFLGGY